MCWAAAGPRGHASIARAQNTARHSRPIFARARPSISAVARGSRARRAASRKTALRRATFGARGGTARCAFPARPMTAASSPGAILRPRAIRARTIAAAAGPSHMFRRSRPSPAPNSSSTSPCRTSLMKARLGQQGVAIRACLRALEGQCPVRGLVVSRGGRWWCPRPDSNQHALADNRF